MMMEEVSFQNSMYFQHLVDGRTQIYVAAQQHTHVQANISLHDSLTCHISSTDIHIHTV